MIKRQEKFTGAYQQGASKAGIFLTLLLVGLFLGVGLKVIPIYMDHNVISNAVKTLIESGRAASMTQNEIRQEIGNNLRINNIRDFDVSLVTVRRVDSKTEISIAYEKRVALIYNIDAVLSFDDKFE